MIKKSNIQWTAKALANQVSKGNVNFDVAIQRGYTWNYLRKNMLIHSLIENYPIPALYLSKREDGKYDGLDGKQRTQAIMSFMNGEFMLGEDFIVEDADGNEHDLSKHSFSDLPEWAQDAIKDFSLTIYYFEDLTEEQYDNIFFRLNNGKPLTAVELTRVKARSLQMFQQLTKHDLINLAVSEKGRVRYDHENLVMQAWAICFSKDENMSFETKIFRSIIENADVTEGEASELQNYFDIMHNIYTGCNMSDKNEKKIAKRLVTRTHFVAFSKAVMVGMENDYEIAHIIEWAKAFYDGGRSSSVEDAYNATIGSGSARKDKVDARMNAIVENMHKFMARIEQRTTVPVMAASEIAADEEFDAADEELHDTEPDD